MDLPYDDECTITGSSCPTTAPNPTRYHRTSDLPRFLQATIDNKKLSGLETCQDGHSQSYSRRLMVHRQRSCPLTATRRVASGGTKLDNAYWHGFFPSRRCSSADTECSSDHRTVRKPRNMYKNTAHERAGMLDTLTLGLPLHGPTRRPTGRMRV